MTSRLGSLVLLALVACGSDPPKTDTPVSSPPPDKTEVKMDVVPIASTMYPPTDPASSAPSTIAPPTSNDPSDDANIGGPQDETVEKAVAPIRPRLRACYKKALIAQPDMNGSVVFDTTIGKDGKVASARFVKKDGNLSDDLINCLTSSAKTMQFATDRRSQVVAFSFGRPQPTAASGSTPASINGAAKNPSQTAPIASFGGADAGPARH